MRAVEPEMENVLRQLLLRMKRYYTYYGFSIRTAYKDFDTHNRAVVTESQVCYYVLCTHIVRSYKKSTENG